MKLLKGLFFATFVSVFLGIIISFYTTINVDEVRDISGKSSSIPPIIQTNKTNPLTQETLVSFLKQIPLNYSYKHVELDGDALFIKLTVPVEEQVQDKVFQDAFQFIHTVYHHTTNIHQIYLRFVLTQETQRALLLALESDRNALMEEEFESDMDQQELVAFVKGKTKVIYGTGWKHNNE